MNKRRYVPPIKLFELLEFCGIRQRDIVTRLGVSKTLVSLWRSGHKWIPSEYYTALLEWVDAVYQDTENKIYATQGFGGDRTLDDTREGLAVLQLFAAKFDAALLEIDPAVLFGHLLDIVSTLSASLSRESESPTWDDETLAYIEGKAKQIATVVKELRGAIEESNKIAVYQERTTRTLRAFLSQLQETPDATAHDRRQCTSQSDLDAGSLRPAATPQPDEKELRTSPRKAPPRVRAGTARRLVKRTGQQT
jgi:hypothetical protein